MRPAKKADESEVWEYVLLYTEDVLVVSENGEKLLREGIGKYFELREDSIGPPELYLGAHLRKVELANGPKHGQLVLLSMCRRRSRMLKRTCKGKAINYHQTQRLRSKHHIGPSLM
jgi:hypothetical protein